MLVTTLITLPEDVYRFYMNTASHLSNTTTEQIIADMLIEFARTKSESATESTG